MLSEFTQVLDEVQHGCLSNESTTLLEKRVIKAPIDKFNDPQKLGHSPICLFPMRKACE